jgi:ribosomal-protein-alanine N-acetyltransferase
MRPINIFLRSLELDDVNESYCSWYQNDDGHLNYFTGSGRSFNRETIIKDIDEGIKTQRWFYYLISSEECEPIGNIKIGPVDLRNKTSDLVCLIGNRKFLGKGLASEAIRLGNEIAFSKHDIRRLHGGMYASNLPSIKAYLRAGWVVEGVLKGYYWIEEKPEDRICVACFNPKYIW